MFALIEDLKQQILDEITSPPEDKRTAFDYGKVHGVLLACGWLTERLQTGLEEAAARQEQRERNF